MGIILEVLAAIPDLDRWLPDPAIRICHRRQSTASPDRLWAAATELSLVETRLLGRLVRWRIPGVAADSSFEELLSNPPFTVLAKDGRSLVSGLVGRIWTLRRDYPEVDRSEFVDWTRSGTAKVVFGHWVQTSDTNRAELCSEARVKAYGVQGRLGMASVRPLIRASEHLIGSDALDAAVRHAERER